MPTASNHVPRSGDRAPDFTLPSTAGGSVSLRDVLASGPALIAFFPLAFTSTCTTELCAFRDDFDTFSETGVTILPISVDATPSLREFKAKHQMRSDLLSDFRRDVSRSYGVLLEEKYYSTRAYFLIDRDGIVRWAHVEETPSHRRENSEIFAEIGRLGRP